MRPFLRSTLVGTFAASLLASALLASTARAAWSPDGEVVPVSDCGSTLWLGACSDGTRGLLTFWSTPSDGQRTVYGLRRLADGSVAPGWVASGNPIGHVPFWLRILAAADRAGGAWVIGLPAFLSSPDARVRVWRVTGAGGLAPGWPDEGVALGDSVSPKDAFLADDGTGGVLVGWVELMKYEFRGNGTNLYSLNAVRLVRLTGGGGVAAGWSASGNTVFEPDSNAVLTIRRIPTFLIADGTGGGWISHADSTDGVPDSRLFRMTPGGALAPGFGPLGVQVGVPDNPQAIGALDSDAAGGVFTLGFEMEGSRAARLGHFQPSGLPASGWSVSGIEMLPGVPGYRAGGDLVADGSGGIVAVCDLADSIDFTTRLRVQRYQPTGAIAPGWAPDGTEILATGALGYGSFAQLHADATGGAFLVGLKDQPTPPPGTPTQFTIYATRIAGDGSFPAGWSSSPLVVGNLATHEPPLALADGRGALFVLHPQELTSSHSDPCPMVAERFGPDGTPTAGIGDAPARLNALRAFPNPMRGAGALQMSLPEGRPVTVEVIDAAGRRVRILARAMPGTVERKLEWDGRDDHGRLAPPGVYLFRVRGPGVNLSERFVRLL